MYSGQTHYKMISCNIWLPVVIHRSKTRKIGDRPCLNLVLGLKRGQTLFKLGAGIKKGDRPCLNIVLELKMGQTLFKLDAGIKKGTDLV